MKTLSRRTLLRSSGMAAAATLLPELHNPVYAADAIPKNFIVFFSYQGQLPWLWGSGSETSLTIDPLLSPLEPFKNDLLFVSGLNMRSAELNPPGDNISGHPQGQVNALTSAGAAEAVTTGTTGKVPAKAKGPSIDQAILAAMQEKAPNDASLRSTTLHMLDTYPTPPAQMIGYCNFKTNGIYVAPQKDPANGFKSLFPEGAPTGGGSTPTPGAGDSLGKRRRAILSFARGEYAAVAGKVEDVYGKKTRERLDAHANNMSELEKMIPVGGGGGGGGGGMCPSGINPADFPSKPATAAGWWDVTSKAMPRLGTLALACGKARFLTLQLEDNFFPGIHDAVHKINMGTKGANDPAATNAAKPYYTAVAGQFANLLKLLKESPTADGKNLLYHSVVLWAGELTSGDHSTNGLKWMLAGNAGGALKTGRYLETNGRPHSDLFLSIASLMGTPMTTFGDARANPKPITQIAG